MEKVNYKYPFYRKRFILPLILAVCSFILCQYAADHPHWTESFYSLFLYPKIKSIIGFIPSLLPFSFFEILIVTIICFLVFVIISFFNKKKDATKNRKFMLSQFIVNLISIICMIYFLFTLTCGLNYYRYPFSYSANYQVQKTNDNSLNDLENLLLDLASKLNDNYQKFNYEDKQDYFSFYGDESITAIKNLSTEYPMFNQITYSHPKPLISSKLFSKAGIGGIFFPFTFESNVNTDIPNYLIPATMIHELAHQAGFMREDEAHFIAYLACINSDNKSLRYSGNFLAFHQGIALLEKEDINKYNNALSLLSEDVKHDFDSYEAYLENNKGLLQKISNQANDLYLKSNKQKNGINDYSQMVQLVLVHYQKENKTLKTK